MLTLTLTNFIALLKDDAVLASTSVFIPLVITLPMAATPWIIAKAGIALLPLIFSPDVINPCLVILSLLGKSAGNV